jgi:hypothetical protein
MNFLIFDRSQRHAIVPASAETGTSCPDWTEILTVNKKEAVLYPSGDGSLIFLITSIFGYLQRTTESYTYWGASHSCRLTCIYAHHTTRRQKRAFCNLVNICLRDLIYQSQNMRTSLEITLIEAGFKGG